MKKIHWISSAFLCLILSFFLHIKSTNVISLWHNTMMCFVECYAILILIILTVQYVKTKEFKKNVVKLVPLFIISISLIYFLEIFPRTSMWEGYPAYNSMSFRTNIFTGECVVCGGGSGGSDPSDRWYLKEGCEVSKEQQIEMIKNTRMLNCEVKCNRNMTHSFCEDPLMNAPIVCAEVFSCPHITC